ncbi:TIGR03086 family metal-binding protein [Nocardia sp. NPDC088792]|uniref:TIGR03086 family metal-binding protein n=1 Tax=Nocardia sp. NPDC088792 TaxID=3364332 RepID=UPI00380BF6CC
MNDLQRLDAMALALLAHDVVTVSDEELNAATPCTGWAVTDLIDHMNTRHEAVVSAILSPLDDHSDSPREDFARTAARWVVAMDQAGEVVHLPDRGPIPTETVLAVHFVDMLIHRWDLAHAVGRPYPVPERLAERALPIAQSITGPGSVLNGPGGVYQPPVQAGSSLPVMDAIAALLGRDPQWEPPK